MADELSQALAKIAELESMVAQLRSEQQRAQLVSTQPPNLILDSIADAFVAFDSEFRYTWVNAEAERFTGMTRDQLLGRTLWEAFPASVGSTIDTKIRQVLAEQIPLEFENYYHPWNRWFHNKAFPTKEGGVAIYWRDITDQKSLQADLRRQASMLEQVHDSVTATDLEGRFTYWNRGAEKIFGYTAEEAIGWHFTLLYFEEDRDRASSAVLEPLLRDGQSEIEIRNRRKSGEECFIRLSLSLLRDEAGQAYGMLGVAADVTAQKQAEEALRESEERFRLAAQAVEGIVYDWDPRTGFVHRSGDLESILGIGAKEAQPDDGWWQQRVHPEDAALSSLSLIQSLPLNRNSFETEFRIRHAGGHWVYASERGYIVRDETGRPVRVVGSTSDISERKRLEQELRFQADILAATNDAVIALDQKLCIRYCNAAAERIYGARLADVMGKPLLALHGYAWLAPEDEARSLIDLVERGSWKGEYIHILNDGSQMVVNCTVNTLSPESGGGLVSVIRDVSARKRAELETKKHAEQLARANADLLHFSYAVSHDLQEPLRTISSFSQLLALKYKARLDAEGVEFIDWIVEAGGRMSTMLRDLLHFTKVAADEIRHDAAVPLVEPMAAALANLRTTLDEAGASITHDPLPTVAGDAGQLTQLFQNLIGNAVKYRKPDTPPAIHVSAERSAEEWIISVRDNGIGFDPKQAERIFGVFQRLHGAEFAGTGIGLTICKRIVERRGGRIWAEGKPGEGATFSFSIPDSTDAIRAAPAMDWERLQKVYVDRTAPLDALNGNSPFDEMFHTLDLAPAMVRDLKGTVVVWTRGAERLFGWSKSEATGQRVHDLLKTEFPEPPAEMEADLLRAGEWSGQLQTQTKDGRAIWLASHWSLYRDGSGRPQSVIEVHNDITALKEAQAALVSSGEQRDLALLAGKMGIWRWDSRDGVVLWDATVEGLLGMDPGSFEGTHEAFRERIHPDDLAKHDAGIAEALERGGEYEIENRVRHNDGGYRWWRGQGRVKFDGGKPAGLLGVVWDITAAKQQELDRQFLLDLSAKLTESTDWRALAELAVTDTGVYLGVSRCSYIAIDGKARIAEVIADYHTAGPSVLGKHPLDAYGQATVELAANRVVAVQDTSVDARVADVYETAYRPIGVRASVAVPLHQASIWLATISASHHEIRRWQEREIALLRGVAERLWPAIENARLLELTRQSREQFEHTFEQAAVGMAHVALDGRWLRVNECVCKITGYTREELLAARFQDITHPDDLEFDLHLFDALKSGQTPSYSMEKRYFHKNGSIVWIHLTVSLMRKRSGEADYAISVVEDITDRKRAALELQESRRIAELRLREIEAIYSRAPVGLLFLDKDLRFVRINEHLARLNGIPVEDHLGRTVAEVLPELAPQLYPILKNILETRIPIVEAEIRWTAPGKPGQASISLVSYFPFAGEDGSVLGLNGVVQDITERKRTEAAWLEATERLWIATSAAQLGVFVWDAREDRVYWENQRMYDITGRTRDQGPLNLDEFLRKLIHPSDTANFEQGMAAALKRGGVYRQQCRIVREDGTRWVEFSGEFDVGADGRALRLTGVVADITDRIEADRAAHDRRQLLLKVLDSLYAFVGVMTPDGILLEANRAPLEAAGIEASEVLGKFLPNTFWWSYSSDVQNRLWEAIHKAQAGEASRFDIQSRMKDGQLVTVDWMISPLYDETGEIRYLIPSAVPIEKRVRMEAALRESEERYLLAEWATNDGLWDWTPATDYCYFSPRFKALIGLEAEELESRAAAIFARLHPEDYPSLQQAVRLHWEDDRPYDLEIRILHKDGRYRWFRTRGKAIRNQAGEVLRMIGSLSDIDDRREAEALAREQDQQWRHMLDAVEQLAWITRQDGQNEWFNRRWFEYTGIAPGQTEWRSVHDPQLLPEIMERWAVSARAGEPFEMEFPLRGADGVFRSFLTRAVPVRDSQGQVVRWFGTSTNIDTLRKEQDLLRESERQFRELAESLPEVVWSAGSTGEIVYVNPQWTVYTGMPQSQGIGSTWQSIVHPEDAQNLFDKWSGALAAGQRYECEARVRRHDGTYRWFLNRAEPVRDEHGRIVKWLGTSTDIHQQKLTEQALRRSKEDLEQFAYAASHDLQEPLRMVSIYTQFLARKYSDRGSEADQFVGYIVDGVRRMDGLLRGILAYSRAGADEEQPAIRHCGPIVEYVLANLRRAILESGAAISCDPLPSVVCAESALQELFQNLIGNALKYRSAERPLRIHVSASREGRWHRFSVADNGIGMKAEYLKQIFGVFKRLHKDEYPGVGIGLAICKRIVERQGGRIWAESELGKGTTFYFTLPAQD